jgi:hypothetical protein
MLAQFLMQPFPNESSPLPAPPTDSAYRLAWRPAGSRPISLKSYGECTDEPLRAFDQAMSS